MMKHVRNFLNPLYYRY